MRLRDTWEYTAQGCPSFRSRIRTSVPVVYGACMHTGSSSPLVRFQGNGPSWVSVLPVSLPPPALALREYLHALCHEGVEAANALLFSDEQVVPPAVARGYVSGDPDHTVRLRSQNAAAFIASQFHAIQHAGETDSALSSVHLGFPYENQV